MCDHLTYLAYHSQTRYVAACEHGTIHLAWQHATIHLSPDVFQEVATFIEAARRNPQPQQRQQAGGNILMIDSRGFCRLWISVVGLCLTKQDFTLLASLVTKAAVAIANNQALSTGLSKRPSTPGHYPDRPAHWLN